MSSKSMLKNALIIWLNTFFMFIFAMSNKNYEVMEKTFTFTVHRYLDGFWTCIRCQSGVDVNQKRRLIYLAKRLGYKYSPTHRCYTFKNHDGIVNAIATFKKEN